MSWSNAPSSSVRTFSHLQQMAGFTRALKILQRGSELKFHRVSFLGFYWEIIVFDFSLHGPLRPSTPKKHLVSKKSKNLGAAWYLRGSPSLWIEIWTLVGFTRQTPTSVESEVGSNTPAIPGTRPETVVDEWRVVMFTQLISISVGSEVGSNTPSIMFGVAPKCWKRIFRFF